MIGYRAIMLEPTLSRALSRAWRPQLIEGLQRQAHQLQYGGRKGLSIEALHLQVRPWQTSAKSRVTHWGWFSLTSSRHFALL